MIPEPRERERGREAQREKGKKIEEERENGDGGPPGPPGYLRGHTGGTLTGNPRSELDPNPLRNFRVNVRFHLKTFACWSSTGNGTHISDRKKDTQHGFVSVNIF